MAGMMVDESTINEWIFPREFIEDDKSMRFENITLAKEMETRFKTVWFMSDLSNALRPRIRRDGTVIDAEQEQRNARVFWTAAVFFQRFFLFHSFESHNRFFMAVACLFLAAKVEEKPLRLRDHITTYFRVRKNCVPPDEERAKVEKIVLNSERVLLQTLNFDLNVVHPSAYFRSIINRDLKNCFADVDVSKQVVRLATTILSDSLRGTLCLEYTPKQLAYAILFVAITVMSLEPAKSAAGSKGIGQTVMPSPDQTWLDLLEKQMNESMLKNICFRIVEMYSQPTMRPSDAIKLEQSDAVKVSIAEFAAESQTMRLRHSALEVDGAQTDNSALSSQPMSPTAALDGYSIPMRMPAGADDRASAASDLSPAKVSSSERHLKPLNDSDGNFGIAESKSGAEDGEGALGLYGGVKRKRSGSLSSSGGKEPKKFSDAAHECDGMNSCRGEGEEGDSMFDYDLPASAEPGSELRPEDTPSSWVASTPNFESLPRPGFA